MVHLADILEKLLRSTDSRPANYSSMLYSSQLQLALYAAPSCSMPRVPFPFAPRPLFLSAEALGDIRNRSIRMGQTRGQARQNNLYSWSKFLTRPSRNARPFGRQTVQSPPSPHFPERSLTLPSGTSHVAEQVLSFHPHP